MDDLTLCIYDELVAKGSAEHEMLESVLNGKKTIKLFGIEYAITHIDVTKYGYIEKFSKGAMDKTTITASRLIPINMKADIKVKA